MKKRGHWIAAVFIFSTFCGLFSQKALAANVPESYDIGEGSFRYADMSDTDWGKPGSNPALLTGTQAAEKGVPPGYTGNVYTTTASGGGYTGINVDLTDAHILVSEIEAMTIRVFVSSEAGDTSSYPEVRIPTDTSGQKWIVRYPLGTAHTGQWVDITLKRDRTGFNEDYSFADLADENGYLHIFGLCVRTAASNTIYIDGITIERRAKDTTPPVIDYKGDMSLTFSAGVTPNITATAFDEYDNMDIDVQYIWSQGALAEDGTLNQGAHTCTLVAIDSSGNRAEMQISVTVLERDSVPPIIRYSLSEIHTTIGAIPQIHPAAYDEFEGANVEVVYDWSEGAFDRRGRLVEGVHTCTLRASDRTGNEASFVVTFIVSKEEETLEDMVDESLEKQDPTTTETSSNKPESNSSMAESSSATTTASSGGEGQSGNSAGTAESESFSPTTGNKAYIFMSLVLSCIAVCGLTLSFKLRRNKS